MNQLQRNKLLLFNKFDKCELCHSEDNLTVDHIKPRSRGGTNAYVNLTILCKICNTMKQDLGIDEFLGHLDRIKEVIGN